jgi:hypothetical protein
MKYIIWFLMFFLGILQVDAQILKSSESSDSIVVEKPQILERKGYTIEIPKGWRVSGDCKDDLCSLLSPPDTLKSYDIFVENINFTVGNLPNAKYTVDQYTNYSINYLPSVVKGLKIIEKKKLKANVYRITYKGEKSNYEQTWRQYYYVKNAKVYIVTFACETLKYDYYLPLVEPYLSSFKLK